MKRSEWADSWLRQARRYLHGAQFVRSEGHWNSCAFLCQLAAEVAVRAAWMDTNHAELPSPHQVDRLAADLGAPPELVHWVRTLTDERAMLSHPQGAPVAVPRCFSEEEAGDWMGKAQSIVDWLEAG